MRTPLALLLPVALSTACSGDDAMMTAQPDAPDVITPDAPGLPTADELRAAIATCNVVGGKYAENGGGTATVDICGLPTAVFWKADLDVDCDGKETAKCNLQTDPYFQNQTAAVDSMGDPLDAATLPFVVVPGVSPRWSYRDAGLTMGSVVAVIYKDKVAYGPLGDVGPTASIGEASYAMAELLGINPDPRIGGTSDEVAYIAFIGPDAKVKPIEDHAKAVELGVAHARALLSP
ncbi:MAG: glycoside hydrolase family 75 protein [Myxococcales bacterium]|nr:glycoside hydrolase family 75 protein [Myxococcales bacterium]